MSFGSPVVESRRELILKRLSTQGSVEVAELSAELAITEETIRRDLQALENRGLLRRAHGGAVGADVGGSRSREAGAAWAGGREAAAIARAASDLVQDAESVYLDAGLLCEALATELAGRRGIRIVTGSIAVALAAVSADELAEVHCIGGTVGEAAVQSGAWAREQLALLHFDVAFIEPSGLSATGQLMLDDPERASVAARAVAASESIILLATQADLGRSGMAGFAELDAIDHAILGAGVEAAIIQKFQDAEVGIETPTQQDAR